MDDSQPHRPELLAPAGDWEALRAAVANGADAVYFGLPAFNARQRATNFALAELPDVLAYLHDHNVKGYVTSNTLIFSDELPRAAEYAEAIAGAGADAVIVQDLGLLRLIRRLVPTLPIHASTQMTQTEAEGIELLRELGVRRVILARELSLSEIAVVAAQTLMPLEVFVHGALCISYSGQCLASAALWGRSANRGVCGQACRFPYELVVDGQRCDRSDRQYLLSPHDLAAYDRIPQLVALGVAGFKIEGRLKSAHYVAAATRVYRAALDAALQGTPFVISPEQQAALVQSFSRGLGHGFLDGIDHQHLVPGRFPKKRGAHVGDVLATTPRGVIVQLAEHATELSVKPGDGVVFDDGHPERDEQGGRVFAVAALGGAPAARVRLAFGRGAVNLAAVAIGSKVWKTDDPAIRRRLETSYRRDVVVRRAPLRVHVEALADQPLHITVRDEAGRETEVSWEQPLRPAEKHALTVASIRRQFERLGNTPFELAEVELRGAQGRAETVPLMVPMSVLNDLRRRAVQALCAQRAAACRHEVAEPDALAALRRELQAPTAASAGDDGRPQLHVLVRDFEQFDSVLSWAPSCPSVARGLLYCDFRDPGGYEQAVARGRAAGWEIGLATPRVLMPGEEGELDRIADIAPDAVLVRSLGALRHLQSRAPRLMLVGDFSLNAANELAALRLIESGLQRVAPAYDLDEDRLAALAVGPLASRVEIVIHAHTPLFHTRHCLLAAALSDGADCCPCGERCHDRELHLRGGAWGRLPVFPDGRGRNTVFAGAARSRAACVPQIKRAGVRHFRVELLRGPPASRTLLDLYARLFAGEEPADVVRELRRLAREE
jgi:putative protease